MGTLLTEFNNFGGRTINDQYESFSKYALKLDNLDSKTRELILDDLKASFRLETIFRTKLYLRYTAISKIKEILLTGDRILNAIIASHKPFIFRHLGVEAFKTEIFPNVSHKIKAQFIRRLSESIEDEEIGEQFFKFVFAEYGIRFALPLLLVCSQSFIQQTINEYKIIFRQRLLIQLHRRFGSGLIQLYYQELSKYGVAKFSSQQLFGNYLCLNDLPTFHHLLQYGTPKVGRLAFKLYLQKYKGDVINNPQKYKDLIKMRYLYKYLTRNEFYSCFINNMPKQMSAFNLDDIIQAIKLLPLRDRGQFMASSFHEKYGCEMYKLENAALENYLPLITVDERRKFHKVYTNVDEMLEFYSPEEAFPLIKEKLNFTSNPKARFELVLKMFKCAIHNKDDKALVEASQYLCQRHKTDNSTIRQDVFVYLYDIGDMAKRSAEFWKYWEEIIKTEQALAKYPYWQDTMLRELLEYKFMHGIDFANDLKAYLKQINYYYTLPNKCKVFQKKLLLLLPEYLPEIYKDDPEASYPNAFLEAMQYWNSANPKYQISYFKFPKMIELAMKLYNQNYHDQYYYYRHIIPSIILTSKLEDPEELTTQANMFEHFDKFQLTEEILLYLLRRRLDIFEKYWHVLFKQKFKHFCRMTIFYELSKLHFTSLPAKLRTKSLEILEDESSSIDLLKIALAVLSYEEDFLEILQKYNTNNRFIPKQDGAVDVFEENIREALQLQAHVCWCLKHVSHTEKVIDDLLRFCQKDYFPCASPLLSHVVYNIPPKPLKGLLTQLRDRPLSINKRALLYSTTLYNCEDICKTLQDAGSTEKNKSLQEYLFRQTFKVFCEIYTGDMWKILLEHFRFVSEQDNDTMQMIFNFRAIPKTYFAEYVKKIWQTYGKTTANTKECPIMNAITSEMMPLLSDDLLNEIIRYRLTHSTKMLTSLDIDFLFRHLLARHEGMEERFDLFIDCIRIESNLERPTDFKTLNAKKQRVAFIFDELCSRLITSKETDKQARQLFTQMFIKAMPSISLPFHEFELWIKAEIVGHALANHSLAEYILGKLGNIYAEYGDTGIQYFAKNTAEIMKLTDDTTSYAIQTIENILEFVTKTEQESHLIYRFVVRLLPTSLPVHELGAVKFQTIVKRLQDSKDPQVLLILGDALKNLI